MALQKTGSEQGVAAQYALIAAALRVREFCASLEHDLLTSVVDRGHLLQAFFEARNVTFEKCLIAGCQEPAIRAHSVQNARVLDLLAVDNHVYAPEVEVDPVHGPYVSIERIGRNKATTFTGVCSQHDSTLFQPIDSAPIDTASDEHRFLLAWRAAFFESHATIAVARQMQTVYKKRVDLGLDTADEKSTAGMYAVGKMLSAWKVFRWRVDLDLAYLSGNAPDLRHETMTFDVARPTVAASGLFSVGTRKNQNDLRCIAINILPLSETKTWVLFSFKPGDRRQALKALRRVLQAPPHNAKYQLSRLLLQRCQNFVLSPVFFESWSPDRQKVVVAFFERTLFDVEVRFDSPDLQLLT